MSSSHLYQAADRARDAYNYLTDAILMLDTLIESPRGLPLIEITRANRIRGEVNRARREVHDLSVRFDNYSSATEAGGAMVDATLAVIGLLMAVATIGYAVPTWVERRSKSGGQRS